MATLAEMKNIIAREANIKESLEIILIPEIQAIFNEIIQDYESILNKGSRDFSALIKKEDWLDIFYEHYEVVGNHFLHTTQPKEDLEAIIVQELDNRYAQWYTSFGLVQASHIDSTTIRHANEAFIEADTQSVVIAEETGTGLSDVEILGIAVASFEIKTMTRSPSVANTQTQAPAEHSKYLEQEVLVEGEASGASRGKKIWITVGDELVRDSHAEDGADQEVDFNSVFLIEGHQLRYPGDSSLGAPLTETINCRCGVFYS